jgi:hypothetical protein
LSNTGSHYAIIIRVSKRDEVPLEEKIFPFPSSIGEGDKGDRVTL